MELSINDFSLICRSCRSVSSKLHSIFHNDETPHIDEMLMTCTSLKVEENDRLPSSICHKCLLKLKNAYTFQQLCKETDESLRKILQNETDNHSINYLKKEKQLSGITVFDSSVENTYSTENVAKHQCSSDAETSHNETIFQSTSTAKKSSRTKGTVSDDSDQKTEVHNWSKDEVLLLIAAYKEHQLKFMDENLGKADIWSKVVNDMKVTLAEWGLPPIDAKKCKTKMDTLKRHYKNLKDSNKKSGNQKITWAFYDEMEELFGGQPWVKPLLTAGSNIANEIDTETDNRPAKRQKTPTSYCEQLLAAKKESSDIRQRHHREKIAAANELTGVVMELVACLKKTKNINYL